MTRKHKNEYALHSLSRVSSKNQSILLLRSSRPRTSSAKKIEGRGEGEKKEV